MGKTIAYFISPHGFGHAARASSVMQALSSSGKAYDFLIFTTIPRWFFDTSLSSNFTYVSQLTDIGLVQTDPLQEDLQETLRQLDAFYPCDPPMLNRLAQLLMEKQCSLVISDIAPLGIQVAKAAGLPSILIENFTWDWIYEEYIEQYPGFERHVDYLKSLFNQADYHILAQPYCEGRPADLTANPICRPPRTAPSLTREKLGLSEADKVVIISLGGVQYSYPEWKKLQQLPGVIFLVPGSNETLMREENLIHLPFHSEFYHPDLIAASDVVVSKIGYSTLAETHLAGKPFGYIPRRGFRETEQLEKYIQAEMMGIQISEEEFRQGEWGTILKELLTLPDLNRPGPKGAEQVATFINNLPT